MKKPTQKQIDAEIKLLESYVPRVRQGTFSDNREVLRTQIRVLKERLSNDDIYDIWNDDEKDADLRMEASNAREWMQGESKERPSVGWKELV